MKPLLLWLSIACLGFGFAPAASAQSTTPEKTTSPTPQLTKPVKPPKIWTNDDLKNLRNRGGVSVVGGEISPNTHSGQLATDQNGAALAAAPYVKEQDPAWYRDQLGPLREQIIGIDAQVRDLRKYNSAAAYTVDGRTIIPQLSGLPLNPKDQIKNLELQRSALMRRINELQDLARRNEILPGDIR